MTDIILHHYPESPFSEKIRLIFGYKNLSWKSVHVPMIMPKPGLIPLTGGYRKTPVMQIGADIYCDTEIIARTIDNLYPDKSIYPKKDRLGIEALARWTDQTLFMMTIVMAFQADTFATSPVFYNQEQGTSFLADRARFIEENPSLLMPLDVAKTGYLTHMANLDKQLSDGRLYLHGETPTIADFSTYHCVWFNFTNRALRNLFEPFDHLLGWRQRMAGFSHRNSNELSDQSALTIATDSKVSIREGSAYALPSDINLGDRVSIRPSDYGRDRVRGTLLSATVDEYVLERLDDRCGLLALHFPRVGFQCQLLKGADGS